MILFLLTFSISRKALKLILLDPKCSMAPIQDLQLFEIFRLFFRCLVLDFFHFKKLGIHSMQIHSRHGVTRKEDKDENHIGKLIRKIPKIKGSYELFS